MKNFIISILSFSFLISCSSGVGGEGSIEPNNSIDEKWSQTFGGTSEDCGLSVQQTTDGGYIITGLTASFGNGGGSDVYLIKTDGSGIEQWSKTFGGPLISGIYIGFSVQQTTDGGYVITGNAEKTSSSSVFGRDDIFLIKTDGSGIKLWSKTFGGENSDQGFSVQQATDGGYIIVGETHEGDGGETSDVYLLKTDGNGTEQWSKTFGGEDGDEGKSVQQTTDGGYIITGNTYSFGSGHQDIYLLKTDGNGTEQWSQTFGGTAFEVGSSVQQTTDGGYVITGLTQSFGNGESDVYLIKTDGSGIEQWSKTFGGENRDQGISVQQATDGGYVITGITESFGNGESDVYLIKTDGSGIEQWSKTFGGENRDQGISVQQATDGGYVITGITESFGNGESDVYLIKTDENGNIN